jgi:hypothetical protein
MTAIDRKAAIHDYKKREAPAGVYVLAHADTGQRWVGYADDLDSIMNRILFTLRFGSHRCAGLQAAWNTHGGDGLAFEPVETFAADAVPRGEALKARLADWRARLDAQPA